jgi:LysM repeat protein
MTLVATALVACGGDDALDIAPTPTKSAVATAPTQPPVAPTTPPAESATAGVSGQQEYTVQAGDTLGAIAAQFGVTVDAIVQANDLPDPDVLAPGDKLIIPPAQ